MRLARFENDRTISFIPPDGSFDLMTYRLSTQVHFSFLIYQFINMWLCWCPASLSEIPLWWVRWESNNDLSSTAFIILFPQSSLSVSPSMLFSCIQVKPLIWVEAQVERHSRSRIEMVLKARSQFKDRR